jgi:uncharacterized coiled-coil DUF342 family protein
MNDRPTPETDAFIVQNTTNEGPTGVKWRNHAERLERERDEALQWKKEMLLVDSQWDEQAVGRLLGLKLGKSIKANIEPSLRELLRERDEAREEAKRLEGAYEDATNYYARIIELVDERDKFRNALREIASATGFDNIGNWARNTARKALEEIK